MSCLLADGPFNKYNDHTQESYKVIRSMYMHAHTTKGKMETAGGEESSLIRLCEPRPDRIGRQPKYEKSSAGLSALYYNCQCQISFLSRIAQLCLMHATTFVVGAVPKRDRHGVMCELIGPPVLALRLSVCSSIREKVNLTAPASAS